MPSRNFEERIRDMVEQIVQLQDFVEGMSFDDFSNDKRTLQAVLYGFAILGEAAASLLPDIQSAYPQVPWSQIRGMRNAVIHEYFQVDLEIIWETVKTDLPRLKTALENILENDG